MNEILIVSNYYPPEKGAAANRIEQMAIKLSENNYKVSVICPLPNYPEGKLFKEYKNKFYVSENREGIQVDRLWIMPSVSKNLFVRILSVFSFSVCLVFYLTFKKTPRKVIVQSPPLLLSFLSVFILSFKRKKIILNISDLWPLAAVELNALRENSISHKISMYFERFIYKKADVILGQSNEILTHVKSNFRDKICHLYLNLPDHKTEHFALKLVENEPIKIFYAGLFGVAQDVFELCKKINLRELNVELHLFGNGVERAKIEKYIADNPDSHIFFNGMISRNALIDRLQTFDVALVPLKTRIYGSVPSKIYEYASLGFPILYFGGGEGEAVVTENNLGWVVPVGNYDNLNKILRSITLITKTELHNKKADTFKSAKTNFNLDRQIRALINKDVF